MTKLQRTIATTALLVLPAACGGGETDGDSDSVDTTPSAPMDETGGTATTTDTTPTGTGAPTAGGTTTPTTGDTGAGGGTGVTTPGETETGGAAAVGCPGQTTDEDGNILITAAEANNYSFSSTLTFEPVLVAPNGNLTFDWSALTRDFLGHPLAVDTDINMVSLMLWRLSQADLEVKLNDDALAQSDLVNLAMFYPADLLVAHPDEGGTRAELLRPATDPETGEMYNASDLTLFMNPLLEEEFMPFFDHVAYPPEGHTFTLIASTGTIAGEGTRMIQGFRLDPDSTVTEIVMTDDSTQLTYETDLHSLTPTQVPLGVSAITVDWGDIATNALGNEFTPTSIAEVQVAKFAETPTELESKFLDLELIATEMFTAEVPAGTSFDLSGLVNDAGEAFTGIDGEGTWIVALICGNCRNPAPWYISTLTPCSE